jgi:hypothetical protein
MLNPTDAVSALDDEKKEGSTEVQTPYSGLIQTVKERWQRAKLARMSDEQRWLRAFRNFRGTYDPTVVFRENEKSRVFIKITKTKTLAAYGQLLEVIFASNKFPIGISPTEKPEGIAEMAYMPPPGTPDVEAQGPQDMYGFDGDGNELPPGATYSSLLGGLQSKLGSAGFKEGPAPDPAHMVQISPAEMAAKNMEKLIHDQLEESSAGTVMRHVLHEMCTLGHGVIKGPFTYEKVSHRWVPGPAGNTYEPIKTLVPKIEAVSVWNFYPDPDAIALDNAEWVVERHALSRTAMRDLLKRPFFREEAIRSCLSEGTNYTKEWFENYIKDSPQSDGTPERFEVLEYWGIMDADMARDAGLEIADDLDELDEVQINAWVCGNQILRLVANPFTPARIPYQACPYEIHGYQFFGIGVPENMEDCQTVMNGHIRMAIDNLAFAGHLVFSIDENALVPGQEMKVYPGKIFRVNQGMDARAAVNGIKFPSTANDNLQMFDKARQLADEATGIPSYSHGSQGAQAMTRTASGMSMLMGAAALNIKTVVKNIDDYFLQPLGESFFHWNMQFNEDAPEIRGDLEIKARGTAALMQKEVRSQRLLTFLQISANPVFAPFIKAHVLLKEIAESLDIEPEKVINDPEQAAIYARIIGMMNNGQGGPQGTATPAGESGMGASGGMGSEASGTDPSGNGGGTIGTGDVPAPGSSRFSANNAGPQG